jgi:acetylornithine/succinyldiaminopimelate/putrescine aminotransferase
MVLQPSGGLTFTALNQEIPMRYGEFDSNSLMSITNRPELTFVRGEGSWLFDDKSKAGR